MLTKKEVYVVRVESNRKYWEGSFVDIPTKSELHNFVCNDPEASDVTKIIVAHWDGKNQIVSLNGHIHLGRISVRKEEREFEIRKPEQLQISVSEEGNMIKAEWHPETPIVGRGFTVLEAIGSLVLNDQLVVLIPSPLVHRRFSVLRTGQ